MQGRKGFKAFRVERRIFCLAFGRGFDSALIPTVGKKMGTFLSAKASECLVNLVHED